MFFHRDDEKQEAGDRAAFWAFMLALPVQITACYVSMLGRVSTLMCLPFAAVAIPGCLKDNENQKLVRILKILIYAAMVAYYAFCLLYDRRELELIPYHLFFMN